MFNTFFSLVIVLSWYCLIIANHSESQSQKWDANKNSTLNVISLKCFTSIADCESAITFWKFGLVWPKPWPLGGTGHYTSVLILGVVGSDQAVYQSIAWVEIYSHTLNCSSIRQLVREILHVKVLKPEKKYTQLFDSIFEQLEFTFLLHFFSA